MNVSSFLTPAAIIIASAMMCLVFRIEVIERSSGVILYDRIGGGITSCAFLSDGKVRCRNLETSPAAEL
jgi:hypothetical protein